MKNRYAVILDHFGKDRQVLKALEELSELAVALHHWREGKVSRLEVVSEIADCRILLEQLKLAFGDLDVEAETERKLQRVEARVAACVR